MNHILAILLLLTLTQPVFPQNPSSPPAPAGQTAPAPAQTAVKPDKVIAGGVIDSGQFTILLGGTMVGTETFTIQSRERAEGEATLTVNGSTIGLKVKTEYQGTHPKSFTAEPAPNIILKFTLEEGLVKLTGPQQATLETAPDAVLLENNIYHHYYFLLQRYDQQKGGRQEFVAFVPGVLQTLPLSLELKKRQHEIEGLKLKLDYYQVHISNLQIELFAEAGGKLFYLQVPAQSAEVIRAPYAAQIKDLRPQFEKLLKAPAPAAK